MEALLKYSKPADYFEEALPLGNGQLGAMVYGKTQLERISINHDTLWSGKPGDTFVEGAYESNEKAKKLGIKTGMTIWEAKNLCPELITVEANMDNYLKKICLFLCLNLVQNPSKIGLYTICSVAL